MLLKRSKEAEFLSGCLLYSYGVRMRKYATISLPEEVKKTLEEAFKRLAETLTEDELKGLIESSREFRERFVLR